MTDVPLNAWSALPGAEHCEFPHNDPSRIEIAGYTDQLAYDPGDTVRLFVHTTARHFDVTVLRDGPVQTTVWSATGVPGHRQTTPANAHAVGCGWQHAIAIPVDSAWTSGGYVIVLGASDGEGVFEREAFFVLRPSPGHRSGRIALIVTSATATAYNDWGGANAYRSIVDGQSTDIPAFLLSLQRPWGRGFIRLPPGAPRHGDAPDLAPHAAPRYPTIEWALANGYSRHCGDAGWAQYDRPFACWAEAAGYRLDYFTQHDLHFNPDCLDGYSCAAIAGHDEYWSWEMRDTMEAFIRRGGGAARFGANYIWQIRLEHEGQTQVCYKNPALDPLLPTSPSRTTTNWDSSIVNRPAATTFGLTGFGGIYIRTGAAAPRASGGYTVYRPDHWAFAGTDLYYADVFGAAPARILAYEVDGVDYTMRHGLPYATHVDGAPDSLEILAMAPAARAERNRHGGAINAPLTDMQHGMAAAPPFYEVPYDAIERGAAMMVTMTSGLGEVFNAGCCNWVSGLIYHDPAVVQITRNVLDRYLTTRTASPDSP